MDHTVQYVRGRTHVRRDVFWFVAGASFMAALWLAWSIGNASRNSLPRGMDRFRPPPDPTAMAKANLDAPVNPRPRDALFNPDAPVDPWQPAETIGPMGSLVVNTDPWSRVTIDGRDYGQTPLPGVPLKPGPHVLICTPQSGRVHRETVVIPPGQRVKRLINLAGGE